MTHINNPLKYNLCKFICIMLLCMPLLCTGKAHAEGPGGGGGGNDTSITLETSDLTRTMCAFLAIFTGSFGKIIISIIVIFLGGMLLLGKVSITTALFTVGGIGLFVGGPTLVFSILGDDKDNVCSNFTIQDSSYTGGA